VHRKASLWSSYTTQYELLYQFTAHLDACSDALYHLVICLSMLLLRTSEQLPLPLLQLYDIDFSGTHFVLVPALISTTDAVEVTAPIWTLSPRTNRSSTPDRMVDTEDALSAHLTAVVQDMTIVYVSSGRAIQQRTSSNSNSTGSSSSSFDAWQIVEPVTLRIQSEQRGCSTTVDVSCR
jgi:hypothetical protein